MRVHEKNGAELCVFCGPKDWAQSKCIKKNACLYGKKYMSICHPEETVAIHSAKPSWSPECWHDSPGPHVARTTKEVLRIFDWERMEHLPYSPDSTQ